MITLSNATKGEFFYQGLVETIQPRNQSDRTCFRRVTAWLVDGLDKGRFNTEIFQRVLSFAKEAAGPASRKPAAVFMYIIKQELHYPNKADNYARTHQSRDMDTARPQNYSSA
jgi:hypothetical protein